MSKPRFETKVECENAIRSNSQYAGCSPLFISDLYAASYGLQQGGWYLYSRNNLDWCVR